MEVSSRRKIFVVLSISSLLFPGYFLRADVAKNTRSGIEVVITGLTRNLAGGVEPEGVGGPENTGNFGVGWTEIWPSSNRNSKNNQIAVDL